MAKKLLEVIGFCLLSTLMDSVNGTYCSYYMYVYDGCKDDILSTGAIFGIVAGCMIAVFIVVSISFCCCFYRAQQRRRLQFGEQAMQPVIPYVPQNNALNIQPYTTQGGMYNAGFRMGPSYSTGACIHPPPPTYNAATQKSEYPTPDPPNEDVM